MIWFLSTVSYFINIHYHYLYLYQYHPVTDTIY